MTRGTARAGSRATVRIPASVRIERALEEATAGVPPRRRPIRRRLPEARTRLAGLTSGPRLRSSRNFRREPRRRRPRASHPSRSSSSRPQASRRFHLRTNNRGSPPRRGRRLPARIRFKTQFTQTETFTRPTRGTCPCSYPPPVRVPRATTRSLMRRPAATFRIPLATFRIHSRTRRRRRFRRDPAPAARVRRPSPSTRHPPPPAPASRGSTRTRTRTRVTRVPRPRRSHPRPPRRSPTARTSGEGASTPEPSASGAMNRSSAATTRSDRTTTATRTTATRTATIPSAIPSATSRVSARAHRPRASGASAPSRAVRDRRWSLLRRLRRDHRSRRRPPRPRLLLRRLHRHRP